MLSRILVVDDEQELGAILKDLLDLEGYEVDVCDNAASANERLDGGRYDVAMLDVFLHGEPAGLDLARHIFEEHPDTSVTLMTGYADQADIESACLSGAYACIAKPFNLDDVVRVVGMVLSSQPA